MGSSTKRSEKRAGAATKAAPARPRVQAPAKSAEARAKSVEAGAKTPARALPIRSSPFGTAPPPRAKLTERKAPVERAAPAPTRKTDTKVPAERTATAPARKTDVTAPVKRAAPAPVRRTGLKSPAKRVAPAPARKKPKTPPFARKPVLEQLEPRLLLSADLNPAAQDTLLATPAMQGAEFRALVEPGAQPVVTPMQVAPIQRTNEIVFVDTATPDYQSLIDDMRTSALTEGRDLEFVLIDAGRDGIRKITDTLAQKTDLDAIHIVSHARDGAVQLGSSQLDFQTLVERSTAIKRWGDALSEDGDILIYGCDLAASEQGKSLVEAMARLTGADVAASEDPTGAAGKGGDWLLEFTSGRVDALIVLGATEQLRWDWLLAAPAADLNGEAVGADTGSVLTGTASAAMPASETTLGAAGDPGASDSAGAAGAGGVPQGDLPNAAAPSGTREVIFVDTSVRDYGTLVENITRANARVVLLDGSRDGLLQIADALASERDIDAIHLISHGSAGALEIGDKIYTASSLGQYEDVLARIGQALTADADILLYGCDIGQGSAGEALIQRIAGATGADVAASTDKTGAIDLGGDWVLEAGSGPIDALTALDLLREQYNFLLAAPIIDVGGVTLNFAGGLTPGNSIATGGLLLSGTNGQVNALYKYTNVATINGTQIDAYVRIDGITNATLGTIDINAPGGYTYGGVAGSAVWAPEINITAANGRIDFSIYFKDPAGNTLTLLNFVNNGIDIDIVGAGPGAEFVEYGGFDSYTVGNPTDLAISAGGGDRLRFTGTASYGGLSVNDVGRISAQFDAVSTLQISMGSTVSTGGNRQFGSIFTAIAYSGPTTTTTAPTVDFVTTTDTTPLLTGSIGATALGSDTFTVTVNGTTYNVGTVPGTVIISGTNWSLDIPSALSPGKYDVRAERTIGSLGVRDQTSGELVINNAPTLADTALSLTVAEDAPVPAGAVGSLVSAFTGGIADPDSGAQKGIAIIGTVETNGTWYYTTDGGTTWTSLNQFNGAVSSSNALLLADNASTRLYFRPNPDYNGSVPGALTFLAWDTTRGTAGDKVNPADAGGAYAFSTTSDVIDVTVTPVADAPVNTVPGAQGTGLNTPLIFSSANGNVLSVVDVDGNIATARVTVTNGVVNVTLAGGATISAGANGTTTLTISGTQADINATLNGLRYTPTAGYTGAATLTLLSTDGTALTDSDVVNITVAAVASLPRIDLDDSSASDTVADNFSTGGYGGSSGSVNLWTSNGGTTNWVENDPEGASQSPTEGDAQVIGGALVLGDPGADNGGTAANRASATRGVDLSNHINASLSFTYSRANLETGDQMVVQVSTNGGTTYTTVGTFPGNTTNNSTQTVSLAGYETSNTLIRFALNSNFATNETVTIDNVTITAEPTGYSNTFTEAVTYVPGSGGVAIADTDTIITDPSGGDMAGATIRIATNYQSGADILEFTNQSGITGTFDATTGTLTLTGNATAANYQTAIESIRFNNSSNAPSTATRTITVVVRDTTGAASNTARTTLNVVATNDAPTGVATTALANGVEDTPYVVSAADLLAGFTDPDGDTLSVSGLTASNGTVVNNGDGTFTITPTANFNGPVTLTYNVIDGNGGTRSATQYYTVTPVNDAPVNTVPGTRTTAEDTAALAFTGGNTISVTDVEGELAHTQLTVTSGALNVSLAGGATISAGANGSASLRLSGTQAQINAALATLTYTPIADFNGTDTLTVVSTDSAAVPLSDTDTVTINVTAVADIVADSLTTAEGAPITANVITGTNGASADSFENAGRAITSVTQGANGTVGFLANGQVTYTPNADFNGADSFTYTVTSGGVTETATVNVTVTPVNDAPVADDEAFSVAEDSTSAALDLLTGDTDVDGDTLSVASINGTALTPGFAQAIAVTNGTVNVSAAGVITFTPAANYTGAISFDYVVSDGNGGTDTGTVSGTVTPVNDAPVADDEAFSVAEDSTSAALDLLTGDTDVDGDTLSVASINGTALTPGFAQAIAVTNGTVNVSAAGVITFTPAANYTGAISFDYVVSDGNGGTDTGTVSGTVTPVNDAPVADDEAFSVAEDSTSAALDLLTGDTDVDGDTLSVASINGTALTPGFAQAIAVTNGTVNVSAAGVITFTPAANYTGAISFDYVVSDGNGGTDTGTVSGTVTPVNDAPVADDEAFSVAEDSTSAALDLLTGDTDVDGDTLSVASINGTALTPGFAQAIAVTNGTVNVSAAGVITFTPAANYTGAISFDYVVSDGNGGTDTGTVSGTVTPVNDAPVADDEAFSVAEDSTSAALDLLTGDTDVDGDTLSVASINGTALTPGFAQAIAVTNGTVNVSAAGVITFTPAANYTGAISFDYVVSDGNGGTDTGTVSGTVTPVNDAPVADDEAFSVAEDSTSAALDLLTGDTDVDGDTLSVASINGTALTPGFAQAIAVTNGTVNVSAAGVITFTPAANYTGAISFDYVVSDGNGGTDTGTVSGTVTPVNDAPVADDEAFSVAEDSTSAALDLLTGDTDVDGDTLSVASINGTALTPGFAQAIAVTNGTVNVSAAGVITFTPAANYTGAISFDYVVSDGNGGTDTGTVSGTVTPVNDAPVADDEAFSVAEDSTSAALDLLTGDTDVDGDTLSVASINGTALTPGFAQAIAVTNGTVNVSAAGVITFTPAANYTGAISFDYVVSDGNGGTDTGTVSGTVTPVNDAPVADDEAFSVAEDSTSAALDLLTGDTDVDGDTLSVASINGTALTPGFAQAIAVTNGTVNVSAAGVITFTPAANYTGAISFDYVVSDGNGGTDTGTVSGTVTPVNDAPVADDEAFSVAEDSTSAALDLLTGDTDVDGDTLSVASINGTALTPGFAQAIAVTNGTVNVSAAGVITFTPAANYTGAISFDYVVSDGNGGTDTGTVSGTVTPVNDAPVADDEAFSVAEDSTSAALDLLTGDTDVDGDTLSVASINGTALTPGFAQAIAVTNGTVNVSAAGVITFTPAANYTGAISFDYVVSDGNGGTDTGTVSGTVTPVNDAPVADDEAFSVAEDSTSAALDLLTGDTDVDGDTLSVASINGTALTPGFAQAIAVTNGTVNVSAAGVITFTPAANYTGAISFDYVVSDGNGGTDTGTVSGTVTPVNDAPVADDEAFSVAEDSTSAALDLLTGDTDVDGDTLSVASINGTALTPGFAQAIAVTNGTVNVSAAGVITFTPAANYTGAISFDYVVSDGNGGTDTGTVSGTVTPVNDAPVADDEAFSVAEDSTSAALDLLTGDTDVDGDTLSVASINGTALTPGFAQAIAVTNGTVNVSAAGVITFTPAANYTGAISFDYVVSDGNGGTDTGTVSGTVTPVNDAPVADDEAFSVAEDSTSAALDLLTGDTDVDGDTLSVASINGTALTPGFAQAIAVTNGTVNVSAAGVITFTPAANYTGAISFDYVVSDGNGGTDTGTVSGTVTPVNDAPVADDEAFSVAEDSTSAALDLLTGDTDVDGDTLSVASINGTALTPGFAQAIAVTNGTVNVSAAGVITFTPAANYTGAISFDYVVSDGNGGTDTGTVSGTVTPVNDAPVADDEAFSVAEDSTSAALDLLTGDTDVDGDTLSVASINGTALTPGFAQAIAVTNGTVNVSAAGVITFTPAANYTGAISFDYVVSDGNGGTDTGTVSGTVTPVNDAPVADDEAFSVAEDSTSAALDLLTGDTDVDGDTLSVASINGTALTPGFAQAIAVTNGTVNVSAAGVITFTPAANYTGAISFDYVVSDGNGGTDTGTVSGTVTPVNDAPVADDEAFSVAEDSTSAALDLLTGDTDVDGDTLSVASINGTALTPGFAQAIAVTNGTVNVSAAGVITFTPAANYTGAISFDYVVSDGNGGTDTGTVSGTVTPVNDAPVADDEAFSVAEDSTSAALDLLTGDTDVDGDTLSVASINGTALTPGFAQAIAVTNGTVNVSAAGVITFTPAANYTGAISFDYVVSDGNGGTDTGTVSGTVTPVNDAPVADDEAFSVAEDSTSAALDLLTGDTDVDGDTLSVASINGTALTPGFAQAIAVTNGTVNVSAAGVITFTPAANYTGAISFDYVVSDGNGGTDTGTVSGTVTPVNDAPVADDEAFSVAEDSTSAALDLLTGDTDVDGDTLSVASINGTALTPGFAQAIAVTNGTVNVSAAGVITFTPAANYTGAISFDYVVSDGNGGTDTGTVSGTVTPVNDAPVADDEAFSVAEDSTSAALDLLTGDTDVDGDTLSVASINGTALTPGFAQAIAVTNGTVNVSAAGVITFTPAANYTGAISFDYVVSDGNGGTDTGTVSGTVTPVNDAPVADDEAFSVAEDSTSAALDLLTGDTDVDGDTLSVASINGTALTPGFAQAIAVTNGTVNVSAAGVITFTPAANYTGAISFDYVVSDGNGGTDTGTVSGTVTPVNDAPVADDEAFSVAEDSTSAALDLLTGDTDVDGDTLSVASINGTALTPGFAQAIAVTNGTVNVSAAGVITFTPAANYTGAISFDYVVSDGNGGTDTGTVSGTVTPVNDAPVADDEAFSVAEDSTSAALDLLTGDTDVDGDTLSVASINGTALTPGFAQAIAVTNGTVNVSAAGVITFTPAANYTGAISFDYVVSDGNGGTDTGTVSGTVTPVNDAPVADDEAFSVAEDSTSAALDLLTGDTDVDGDTLSVASINGTALTPGFAQAIAVTNGTVNVSAAGVITFTPAANYTGAISFDYVVSDGNGGTDTGTVSGTVTPVNDAPVADDEAFSVAEDSTSAALDLLTGDTDVDGDTLSVASINGTALTPGFAQAIAVTNGTVNVSAAGVITFTPAANYTGAISFDYVVSDGNGGTDTGTVSGTVTPVNDAPVADDEAFSVAEDSTSAALDLLTGDTDVDGDTLSVASINGTALTPGFAQAIAVTNGTVNVSAAGVITFTPAANYTGAISFDYVVSDGNGGTDTGTVSGTVTPVNDAPVADDEAFSVAEDSTSAALDLLTGDTDVDGDTLSVASINGTALTPGFAQAIAVTNGTVNVSAAGVITFTPAANYTGAISFDYVVSDGNGGTDTGTVSGTVTPVNDAPVADDEAFSVAEDSTSAALDLLTGDTDVDGDTLSVASINGTALTPGFAQAIAVTNGTVNVSAAGVITFTPAANYTGAISFDYVVSDGNGGTDTGTVSGTVTPVNDAPVADDEAFSVAEDSTSAALDLLTGDTDVDGDTLSVASINGTALTPGFAQAIAVTNGTVNVSAAGVITFTPAANYTGAISFDYVVSDGNGGTDTGTVSGTVTPVNDAPVADDEAFSVAEDSTSAALDLLTGDTDVDGDTLSVASINGTALTPGFAQAIAVTNGTVNVSAAGVITFTPAANYTGAISFDYVVSDGNGGTDTGTVSGTVTPVNDAPVADDEAFSVAEDSTSAALDLLTGDTDVDGDTLSVASINGTALTPGFAQAIAVTNGTVNVSAAGVITFTPAANYTGAISFDYVVSDGNGGTDTGTVSGTVTPVNDAPVADDEAFSVAEDSTSAALDLLTGDTDVDGDTLSVASINGTALTPGFAQAIAVTNGTVNVSAAGVITFTPAANYTGAISFDYVVSDGNGGTDTGTVSGTVTPVNDAPVADDEAFSVAEDSTSAALDLLTGDTDVDGDTLSVASINGTALTPGFAQAIAVTNGTVNVSAAGVITFTPAANYTGAISFDYVVSDGNGGTDTGTVSGTVTPVNDAPVADDEAFSVAEDSTSAALDLLTGDTDVDGDTLSVASINGTALTPGFAQAIAVTNGTVNVSAAGVITFTPAANYTGAISFDYVVSDGNGGTDTGTVSGTVTPVNDAPVADDEAFSVAEDSTSAALDLLTGDTDVDGDTLSVASINGTALTPGFAQAIAVTNGTVNVSAAGVITFTPAANYTGAISFDYVVSDGNGGTDTGTVSGTVTPVNDAPVADDEAFSVAEDSTSAALDLLTGDTDVDGDTLSVASINGTALTPGFAQAIAVTNGTVNVSAAGVITFTPAANYTGAISFDYVVSDGNGGTDTGTVSGTVTPVNDAPVADDEAFSVAEDSTSAALDLLTGDTDVDGDTLSVASINGTALTPGFAQAIAVTNGTVNVSAAGVITFTPAANYTGAISFDYVVSDGNGGTDTGTVSGTVTPVNDAPVADDEAFSVAEDSTSAALDLLTGDTDVDGDTLSVASINGTALTPGFAQAIAVTNGTVNVSAAGVITFTPAANYTGAISFDYVVSDGNGGTDTGTVSGTVTPVNDAPVADDEAFSVAEDSTSAALDLLTGDTDVDGDTLSVASINGTALTPGFAQAIAVTNGTVNVSAAGVITFTPAANYTGAISFDYVVSDGNGGTDTGTVSGTVTPVNDAPVADDEAFSVAEDSTSAALDLLTGDTDVDGDTLSVASINGTALTPGFAQAIAVTNGTVNVSAAGVITFTPAANYTGAISFDYVVSDGNGGTDTGTVSGTVTPVNDAPVADDEAFSVAEDSTSAALDLLTGDTDVDGDTLSVASINGTALTPGFAQAIAVTNGTVNVSAAGVITFTPAANYTGAISFDYVVSDGNGGTDTGTVSGTVTPVNDAPVADDEAFSVAEDSTSAALDLLTGDTDVDGDTLSVASINGTALTPGFAQAIAVTNGTVNVSAAGVITFTPAANYTGAISFDYVVSDGNGGTDTGTVSGTVTPVNDAPVADDEAFSVAEDSTSAALDLLTGDTDVDGDTLSVASINGTALTPGFAQAIAVTNGTVNVSAAGVITFTPAANYTGAISFDYVVSDGNGGTDTGTVSGTVTPVNDAPVADDEAFSVAEDSTSAALDLLTGDTDVDGDTLSVASINGTALTPGFAQAIAVTNGTVNVSAAGVITFTPAANYTGAISFDYVVSDGNGGTDTGTVSGTVTPVNDAPVADDEAFSVAEDSTSAALDLLTGDTDVDGDTLSVASINGTALTPGFAQAIAVTNGTVNVSAAGVITFTPAANYTGAISFDYVVSDGNGGTDTGTVNITVTAADDAFADADEVVNVNEDSGANIGNVLAGTTSPDGPVSVTTFTVAGDVTVYNSGQTATIAGVGTLTIAASGAYTFTPAANYNGAVPVVTYTVTDGLGPTDTSTLTLAVTAVNDAPALDSNNFPISDGGTLTLATWNLSATDPDDVPVDMVFTVSGVTHGRFELLGVPTTTFTQDDILMGRVQFVHDGSGLAPGFTLDVSDPAVTSGPYLGNIVFTGGGGAGGGTGGGAPGGTLVGESTSIPTTQLNGYTFGLAFPDLSARPDMLPHPTLPLLNGVAQEYVRAPAGPAISTNEEETGGVQSAVIAPAGEKPVQAPAPAAGQLEAPKQETGEIAPIQAQPDTLATAPAGAAIEVKPLRAEMDSLPTRPTAIEGKVTQQRDVLGDALRIGGAVVSIGGLAWIAHATGLMRKLLAVPPALRRGLAPVLWRDDEKRSANARGFAAPPRDPKTRRKPAE